ncbi:MAG: serine/threonine protein kinase [Pirellulales bacterium]|nr:serine/threonine protein kinase [Pirellulales bacterium]
MSKLAVDSFLELVRRSGLVDNSQLERTLSVLDAEQAGESIADSRVMAKRLVDAGLLTDWQTQNLLEGRYKRFFLGKHKLLRHLGTGGMSSVYLAEHVMLRRREAIKVLPQNKVDDSSYLDRFLREAQAAAKLEHPNIVRTYDIGCEDKTYYIAMEFIEGRDLYQRVKDDGPLGFEVAAKYVCQGATGLAHAHEKGLVHRDVKPANLLVDAKGTVKLLDLGLALEKQASSLTIAHGEEVLGTADYCSPEQAINSHDVDARADIYSLGCTLYYLLTGNPPFPEGSLAQRLMKHQLEQPKSILEYRPETPHDLVRICQKMMAKKREDRFQSALEVRQVLLNWLATRSGSKSGVLARAPQPGSGSSSSVLRGGSSAGKNQALSDTATGKDVATFKGPSSIVKPGATPRPTTPHPTPLKTPAAQTPGAKPTAAPKPAPAPKSTVPAKPVEPPSDFDFPADLLGEINEGVSLDAPPLAPAKSKKAPSVWRTVMIGAAIAIPLIIVFALGYLLAKGG